MFTSHRQVAKTVQEKIVDALTKEEIFLVSSHLESQDHLEVQGQVLRRRAEIDPGTKVSLGREWPAGRMRPWVGEKAPAKRDTPPWRNLNSTWKTNTSFHGNLVP